MRPLAPDMPRATRVEPRFPPSEWPQVEARICANGDGFYSLNRSDGSVVVIFACHLWRRVWARPARSPEHRVYQIDFNEPMERAFLPLAAVLQGERLAHVSRVCVLSLDFAGLEASIASWRAGPGSAKVAELPTGSAAAAEEEAAEGDVEEHFSGARRATWKATARVRTHGAS